MSWMKRHRASSRYRPNGLKRYIYNKEMKGQEELRLLDDNARRFLSSLNRIPFSPLSQKYLDQHSFLDRHDSPRDLIKRYKNTRGRDARSRLVAPVAAQALLGLQVFNRGKLSNEFLTTLVGLAEDYAHIEVLHQRNKGRRLDRVNLHRIHNRKTKWRRGYPDLAEDFAAKWKSLKASDEFLLFSSHDRAALNDIGLRFDKIAQGSFIADINGKSSAPKTHVGQAISRARFSLNR